MTKFWPRAVVIALGVSVVIPAHALEFSIGNVYGSVISFFTVGAAMRMEERSEALIAKQNLNPGLCVRTTWTDAGFGADGSDTPTYLGTQEGDIGRTCNDTQLPDFNRRYVETPGNFNINGDNGNMNFDQYDVVSAVAKLNSKIDISFGNFNLFGRGIWFFNETINGFDTTHFDTTLQPGRQSLGFEAEKQFGTDFLLQDLYVSTFVPIGDRTLSIRVGRQGLNWGESTALPLNSINTINPPDQRLARLPGFDLAELFRPVGMAVLGLDLTLNLSMEAFYQFEWRPAVIDAPGTFFSTSDVVGGEDDDGYYAMLSFGKAPEDPYGIYSSQDNGAAVPLTPENDPFALGSASSRTIYRGQDREARDSGQFGVALRYFAENFNNGTEFGFYFANYHNRLPSISFRAADQSCADTGPLGIATNVLELAINCGVAQGDIGTLRLSEEPLPVDTAELFVEYVEDIQMFGFSFNTTIGNWAWSGEYSFRPNMPLQIQSVDLTFAALQPAFPTNNINLTDLDLLPNQLPQVPGASELLSALTNTLVTPLLENSPDGLPGAAAVVLPGRRMAAPDYVETIYRDRAFDPVNDPRGANYYIPGFERVKLGQLTTTFLNTIGGDNPLKASQIVIVAEAGLTHVVDMPSLDELQFQGAESNTHISSGADGTQNLGVTDSASATGGFTTAGNGDEECLRRTFDSDRFGPYEAEPCRQNPTAEDPARFGDAVSYGVRFISLIRYQDFFMGANFEPLIGAFYDIDGVAPGIGQNFYEGNFTGLLGLRFDYLSKWFTELRYTYINGKWNSRADRDTLAFSLRYEF